MTSEAGNVGNKTQPDPGRSETSGLHLPYSLPPTRLAALKRRELLVVGAGGALAWSLGAGAQQKAIPVIGWLAYTEPGADQRPSPNAIGDGILDGLRNLGWVEGKTTVFEWRFAERQPSRLPRLAAELVDRHVDLIIAPAPACAAAAVGTTQTIPIIALADDMQASGLVASVSRPGGNVTGVSIFASELDAKRLALLLELAPKARRIAALAESSAGPSIPRVQRAAHEFGIELVVVEAGSEAAIAPALDKIASAGVDAVNVLASAIIHNGRQNVLARINALRLPAIYQWPEYATDEDALIGYGPRQALIGRLVAEQTDRVLRGAPVATLPVVQPTRFELVINSRTARKLGLSITQTLFGRADEVIE
jgi:putative ABC transport system substrate-binding protein